MRELSFVLSHYFALGLLALISYVFGRRLTWRVSYHSLLEQISFSVALGLGFIAYLVLFLGLIGLLYPLVVALALLIGLLICYAVWFGWVRALPSIWARAKLIKKSRWLLVTVAGIVILVFSQPIWFSPLYPPVAFDATFYHLVSAKIYIQNHQIVYTPYLRYVVLPQTNQMLFTLALLLFDDVLAHLIQFLMMITVTGAVIAFGRRFLSRRAGWWAAALLLASPLVLWLGKVAYVDMGLMFFSMMAVYAFWNWLQSREQQHWLVLAGVFCGLAATTKYQGLFSLCIFGSITLFLSLKERKYRWPIVFGLATLLVVAPWFLRNFYYTRNPIFPLLYDTFANLFGYGQWTPEHNQGMFEYSSFYGVGTSLQSLLKLPWLLAFDQDVFKDVPISSTCFVLLPLSIAASVTTRRIRGLLALTVAYTLFWFFTIQALRFLVPALPMLSLLTGAALDRSLHWLAFLKRWTDFKVVTVLGVGLLVYPGWKYALDNLHGEGPLPVTEAQKEDYLTRKLPSYPIYKLLNELKGANYTLYAMHDENMAYFVSGVYMGDWFGPARYARIDSKFADGQALYDELRVLGADYFLVNNPSLNGGLPQDSFFKKNFALIYSRGNASLFEINITENSLQSHIGPQLLLNPSFENINEGWPTGWGHAGSPVVDASGKYSHTGSSAVRCTGADNTFFQLVQTKPGEPYMLSFEARAIEEGQRARLQVNWTDAQGTILKTDLLVVTVGTDWARYEITVTAPPLASYAVVYATCHDRDSSAWFDDFSFFQIQ